MTDPREHKNASAALGAQQDPVDRPQLVPQLGHSGTTSSAAFSPDAQYVATAGWGHTAILWSVETGEELKRFRGRDKVRSVAFSPDGRFILTGGDEAVILWSVRTGEEIKQFRGGARQLAFSPDGSRVVGTFFDRTTLWSVETGEQEGQFKSNRGVAFSPDGRHLLASDGNTAVLRSVPALERERHFKGHTDGVTSVAFSPPDGRYALTADETGRAILWSAESGDEIHRLGGHTAYVNSVGFSPDGRQVLTASVDSTIRVWSVETGEEQQRFDSIYPPLAAAFSPDGRWFLTFSNRSVRGVPDPPILWSVEAGKEIRRLRVGKPSRLSSLAFSRDGRQLLIGGDPPVLWSLETGQERMRLKGDQPSGDPPIKAHSKPIKSIVLSPDGRQMLTGGEDATAILWSTETRRPLRRFEAHEEAVTSVAFSADGRQVLTGSSDGTAVLWSAKTGEQIRRFEGHDTWVTSVAISPDGQHVLTGRSDGTTVLWPLETAEAHQLLDGQHLNGVNAVAFSPDGRHALTFGSGSVLWSVPAGKQVRRIGERHTRQRAVALSPDGGRIVIGSYDATAIVWSTETGDRLLRVQTYEWVQSVTFSPDGRFFLTATEDQSTRIWSAETGREVARLISFTDGTWAVTDPQGRFDASTGGDIEGLIWVAGLEPISLSQLKERYYEPGLLAKIMGFDDEPLRDVEAIAEHGIDLSPAVEITHYPTVENPTLRLHLENRDGGVGRVAVFINGKEHIEDARPAGADPQAESLEIELDLAGSPLMIAGADNKIEVVAHNAAGSLAGRGIRATAPGAGAKSVDPPALWALVAGVSNYQGKKIDLKYAAKDAEDFGKALEIAARGHGGFTRSTIKRLTDESATRAKLEAAFVELAAAQPTDVLVIYLAGHGITWGDDYYFLLHDATSLELKDEAVRKQAAISSRELTELIKTVPALKQVLVLDTCASGQLIADLTESRTVSSSQTRSLERMKDRTGMFVLAGSAADAVSYETSEYGQGLLTYSLLEGMKGAALRDDVFVDVQTLFGHAVDRVPALAGDIGGIQQPRLSIPGKGGSFDVGQLDPDEREKIPLAQKRPLVLRTDLHEADSFRDKLKIGKVVDEALRELARGRDAPIVFLHADEFSNAFLLAGRYNIEGETVRLEVKVSRGDQDVDAFEIEGSKDDLKQLTDQVVERARRFTATPAEPSAN